MFEHFRLQEKRMIFAKKMNKRKKEEERIKEENQKFTFSQLQQFFCKLSHKIG